MAKTMGRPTIFEGKKTHHIHGSLTDEGSEAFEAARADLAKLASTDKVSDGNTIEYLALGKAKTKAYLKGKRG